MTRKSLLVVFAILVAVPALAASPPWTAAGTTAVIDESSVPLYALTPPYLGFAPGAGVGVITAYFNVTDTSATTIPDWDTLEISYFDNSIDAQVWATLYQLDKCNGTVVALCTATSVDNPNNTCKPCTFTQQIDFTKNDYYVTAKIYRASAMLQPKLFGVRVF